MIKYSFKKMQLKIKIKYKYNGKPLFTVATKIRRHVPSMGFECSNHAATLSCGYKRNQLYLTFSTSPLVIQIKISKPFMCSIQASEPITPPPATHASTTMPHWHVVGEKHINYLTII